MAKEFLTDEQVEMEIERLRTSPMVQLARKEIHVKYKRRQALYQLRNLEKRGIQLSEKGITMDNIEEELFCKVEDEAEFNQAKIAEVRRKFNLSQEQAEAIFFAEKLNNERRNGNEGD